MPAEVPVPAGGSGVVGVTQISQLPGPGTEDSGKSEPAHSGLQYLLSLEKIMVGMSGSCQVVRPLDSQFLISARIAFVTNVCR